MKLYSIILDELKFKFKINPKRKKFLLTIEWQILVKIQMNLNFKKVMRKSIDQKILFASSSGGDKTMATEFLNKFQYN